MIDLLPKHKTSIDRDANQFIRLYSMDSRNSVFNDHIKRNGTPANAASISIQKNEKNITFDISICL
jgi:hypothetical protein